MAQDRDVLCKRIDQLLIELFASYEEFVSLRELLDKQTKEVQSDRSERHVTKTCRELFR